MFSIHVKEKEIVLVPGEKSDPAKFDGLKP